MYRDHEDGFLCTCPKGSCLLSTLLMRGSNKMTFHLCTSPQNLQWSCLCERHRCHCLLAWRCGTGVQCCCYGWGVYVGAYSVSQLQDEREVRRQHPAHICKARLHPLLGRWLFSLLPAQPDETNQNSFEEDTTSLGSVLTLISLIIRAILLAGNNLLWVQLRAILKILLCLQKIDIPLNPPSRFSCGKFIFLI